MKKHLLLISTAIIAIALVFAVFGFSGSAKAASRYDSHDIAMLRAFFEQTSPEGVKNGDILFENYDPDDPDTWVNANRILYEWTGDGRLSYLGFIIMNDPDAARVCGELDLSDCTELTQLDCGGQQLNAVKVDGCTSLAGLWIPGNPITALSFDGCFEIEELIIQNDDLSSINCDGLTRLRKLICDGNPLESISVKGCSSLENIQCTDVELGSIDLTDCVNMVTLNLPDCGLDEVFISEMPGVKYINLSDNRLTAFDLSSMEVVGTVHLENNRLQTLVVGVHQIFDEEGAFWLNCPSFTV